MKRKLTAITGMLCAAAMTVSMAACNNKNSKEAEVSTFVSLDINPAIELTLDTDNKVVSVVGSNEDGKVLLYGECNEVFSHSDKLFEVGLDIPQATKLLIALKNKGFDVDCGAYTVEDALAQINKLYEI